MYEIAVVVVDDEHVTVALGGGLDEASGEVGEDLAGRRGEVSIDEVRAESWGSRGSWMEVHGDVGVGGCGWRGGVECGGIVGMFVGVWAFGGLEVSALLIEVAFDHGDGRGWMAANLGGC